MIDQTTDTADAAELTEPLPVPEQKPAAKPAKPAAKAAAKAAFQRTVYEPYDHDAQ
ncbi:hypothetical protein [Mycobacteroides chelonae]|uniref:hypothetical protein n=1 Tax=Mycobacteroides chelonae TaxID=1774 RepID=UPI0012FFA46E|nr:hypothetical protein [Mycobacteroides chelonae]